MKQNVIAFKNQAQKILFDGEIRGQISDGYWENARPCDHYKSWCQAITIVDPKNPGRNFYVTKDNYGLTSPTLLEIVGARMIESVQKGTNDASYDKKRLRADLREMSAIFKTFNQHYINWEK